MLNKSFFPSLALVILTGCQEKQTTLPRADETATLGKIANAGSHPGAALHQEKCAGCHIVKHDASLYQREGRKVNSYERLQSQVRLCNSNLELQLFDDDMTLIGEYLNQAYYNFPMR